MKIFEDPFIKLKETIDQKDYKLITKLKEECFNEEQVVLKLELEYKLGIMSDNERHSKLHKINEFMYFDGQMLIGYLGICCFGGQESTLEVNGMVHPKYRRQGVFKKLYELVMEEVNRRNTHSILLLSGRNSISGQNFIKGTGAQYEHSEYEMYLKENKLHTSPWKLDNTTLRKATNKDAVEIKRQDAIYFSDEFKEVINTDNENEKDDSFVTVEKNLTNEEITLPEEEEKRGMTIYLAEKEGEVIGKVNLEVNSKIAGIYGLGVLPEYRGQGFGRTILMLAVEKLREDNVNDIMLQVASKNSIALNLYKSCGFVETSIMDYYEVKI